MRVHFDGMGVGESYSGKIGKVGDTLCLRKWPRKSQSEATKDKRGGNVNVRKFGKSRGAGVLARKGVKKED